MITKRSFLNHNQLFFLDDAVNNDLTKTASLAQPAQEYLEKIEAEQPDNRIIMVVNGLGSGEYYGANINGDYFPESALLGEQTESEASKNPEDAQGKCLPRYKTFNNGHVFKHHNNDDPEQAIGDIIETFFNDQMHRVENIISVDPNKGEDIIRKKQRGESLPVSMGCKVPEDYCSICGNAAPTRAKYCEHLKGNIGEILDDGRQCYAINRQPRFFDLSFVTVPADKTAYTLRVVGPDLDELDKTSDESNSTNEDAYTEFEQQMKTASAKESEDKNSDIDKEVKNDDTGEVVLTDDKLDEVTDNEGLVNYIENFMTRSDVKEAQLQWALMSNLLGKEAAAELRDSQIYFEPDHDMSININSAKLAERQPDANRESIRDFIEQNFKDRMFMKSAQQRPYPGRGINFNKSITPQPVPLPNFKKMEREMEQQKNRTVAGVAIGSILSELFSAAKQGDKNLVSKILTKHPYLTSLVLGITGGVTGGMMSEDGSPEQFIGERA